MDKRYFSDKIVKWYEINKRELPWRQTKDPYKIWLSEIILQQTRVNQGLPYYHRFTSQYPTVKSLALAPEQDVLRMWQGLGYYSRARNLHKCAQAVMEKHGGEFPSSYQALLTLPGIGEYTAAAIASIAFAEPVAVVDGNVFRVLARNFGVEEVINTPTGKQAFTTLANQLISNNHPDLHNQAVMEFGALHCTPKNPACASCIFQKSCFAYKHQLQAELPVKAQKAKSRTRYFYYVVMEHDGALLMGRRHQKDIWLGLFDFFLFEKNRPVKAERLLEEQEVRKIARKNQGITISRKYKHILTHQTIFSTFIVLKQSEKVNPCKETHSFYSFKEVGDLPKPVLITRFLSDHYLL
jgi:A/G-specific adenine glycosylase